MKGQVCDIGELPTSCSYVLITVRTLYVPMTVFCPYIGSAWWARIRGREHHSMLVLERLRHHHVHARDQVPKLLWSLSWWMMWASSTERLCTSSCAKGIELLEGEYGDLFDHDAREMAGSE
jgi:hypothetical protein